MEESMKPISLILLSTVAVLGLAAACSSQDTGSGYSGSGDTGMRSSFYPGGGATVVYQHLDGSFNYQDVSIDSRGKPVPVVVGGGGAAAHPALTYGVAQEIQGANWGAPLNFVPASGRELARANADPDREQIASPFSIVMMFDAPRDVTAAQLCANPTLADATPGAAVSGSTTLLSALCRYGKEISETTAHIASISGPNDPGIGDLVTVSVKELTNPTSIKAEE
jgi:hypothetical protein